MQCDFQVFCWLLFWQRHIVYVCRVLKNLACPIFSWTKKVFTTEYKFLGLSTNYSDILNLISPKVKSQMSPNLVLWRKIRSVYIHNWSQCQIDFLLFMYQVSTTKIFNIDLCFLNLLTALLKLEVFYQRMIHLPFLRIILFLELRNAYLSKI